MRSPTNRVSLMTSMGNRFDFDKMYRVIVAGGFSLVTTGVAMTGCGDTGFPREGTDTGMPDTGTRDLDADVTDTGRSDTSTLDTGFPMEGPIAIDSGTDSGAELDAAVPDASAGDSGS